MPSTASKVSAKEAGYMELRGATKNAGCSKVDTDVSTLLGCCNLFEPETPRVAAFRCGTCEYVERRKEPLFGG